MKEVHSHCKRLKGLLRLPLPKTVSHQCEGFQTQSFHLRNGWPPQQASQASLDRP